MFMIIFILHDPEHLDSILSAWDEVGVKGITILPSTGLARLRNHSILREDLPLIPSLEDMFNHVENLNRTLITIVQDERILENVITATQAIIGDLNEPNTGILSVIPLYRVYGLDRKDE
jgi:nitrogen regulatory protein P-II 1